MNDVTNDVRFSTWPDPGWYERFRLLAMSARQGASAVPRSLDRLGRRVEAITVTEMPCDAAVNLYSTANGKVPRLGHPRTRPCSPSPPVMRRLAQRTSRAELRAAATWANHDALRGHHPPYCLLTDPEPHPYLQERQPALVQPYRLRDMRQGEPALT